MSLTVCKYLFSVFAMPLSVKVPLLYLCYASQCASPSFLSLLCLSMCKYLFSVFAMPHSVQVPLLCLCYASQCASTSSLSLSNRFAFVEARSAVFKHKQIFILDFIFLNRWLRLPSRLPWTARCYIQPGAISSQVLYPARCYIQPGAISSQVLYPARCYIQPGAISKIF